MQAQTQVFPSLLQSLQSATGSLEEILLPLLLKLDFEVWTYYLDNFYWLNSNKTFYLTELS